MDNVKTSWRQSHKPTTCLIQLYSALLHNAHLKGFISGQIYQGKAKYACAPGFSCYSCPSAAGACPLGSIQNALASSGHSAGCMCWASYCSSASCWAAPSADGCAR